MKTTAETALVLDGLYRHYKGKMYRVKGIVRHSETLEEMVHYECLYDNDLGAFWVRPKELFLSEIEIDGVRRPRFELMESAAWI